jgi:hypothetical protein
VESIVPQLRPGRTERGLQKPEMPVHRAQGRLAVRKAGATATAEADPSSSTAADFVGMTAIGRGAPSRLVIIVCGIAELAFGSGGRCGRWRNRGQHRGRRNRGSLT